MFTEVMSESCFPKDSCRTGRFLELLSISGGQQKKMMSFLKLIIYLFTLLIENISLPIYIINKRLSKTLIYSPVGPVGGGYCGYRLMDVTAFICSPCNPHIKQFTAKQHSRNKAEPILFY